APPPVALPEPSLQGTPEALPSRILRHLSSPSASRAASCYAWLRAARAGLSHRPGGAAHAVGTAWPTAGGTGGCARGAGAKRPFEFPIRRPKRTTWLHDYRKVFWTYSYNPGAIVKLSRCALSWLIQSVAFSCVRTSAMRSIDALVCSWSTLLAGTLRWSQLAWKCTASPDSTSAPVFGRLTSSD